MINDPFVGDCQVATYWSAEKSCAPGTLIVAHNMFVVG